MMAGSLFRLCARCSGFYRFFVTTECCCFNLVSPLFFHFFFLFSFLFVLFFHSSLLFYNKRQRNTTNKRIDLVVYLEHTCRLKITRISSFNWQVLPSQKNETLSVCAACTFSSAFSLTSASISISKRGGDPCLIDAFVCIYNQNGVAAVDRFPVALHCN